MMTGRFLLASACLAGIVTVPQQRPTFKSETRVVRVDVLASERGRPVLGLTADDFEVLDDGVPQHVRLVERDNVPVSVTLVLDTSQSVAGEPFRHLTDASIGLLDALRKGDTASLIVFDDTVRILVERTADAGAVARALERVTPAGRTSLDDGAYAALLHGSTSEGRRLVVLFSDGLDNQSWVDREAVLRAARRSEAVVYGVGLRNRDGSRESDRTRSTVELLPAATGGQLLHADTDRDLPAVFLKILSEFRQRYWLAYAPAGVVSGDGWHTLTVRVKKRGVSVKSRLGYDSSR